MQMTLYRFLSGTLRGRLIVSVAAVHAAMMALFVADLTVRQQAMLLDRQSEEAAALSQTLATSAAGWIAADDIAGMQELVDAQLRYPELLFAMLANKEGRVLAATDKSKRGLYLLDLPRDRGITVFSRTPALVDIATPAMIAGRHVGWARVGIGQKIAGEKLAAITRSGMLYALAAILAGSVIAWFMGRRITRRLYAIQETINAVRSGNNLARSPLAGIDEPAAMAQEFNAMLDALAERARDLRVSEERFRSLIHNVPVAIVLHDGTGRIVDHNPLAQELLGFSEEQFRGKTLSDPQWRFLREDGSVMPPDEFPAAKVLSSRRPVKGLITGIVRPDTDTITWVLVNAEPEYDGNGAVCLVIVSFMDISNRKFSEEALHRLNRELRAISDCGEALLRAENEPDLLHEICRIICDVAGYHMAWVGYAEHDEARSVRAVAWAGNEDSYLDTAGISWADSERGRGPTGLAIRSGESFCIQDFATDPKAEPWREKALQRGYRSSIALPLKDEGKTPFGSLNIYSTKPNAFTSEEIHLLEELAGDLAFGIAVLRDRANRTRAEEALQKSRAVVENIFSMTTTCIAYMDSSFNFIMVNAKYAEADGRLPEYFIGRNHFDLYPDAENERIFRDVVEKGEPYLAHARPFQYADRPERGVSYWDWSLMPVKNAKGSVEALILSLVEVTDRVRSQEELHKLNAGLEQRVRERTAELEAKNEELERLNQLFVGREIRMVELKKRIKELEGAQE